MNFEDSSLCYNPTMTKLLELTLSKIRTLPDDKQDALAQMLARELEQLELANGSKPQHSA
jgi:hypothetical protein